MGNSIEIVIRYQELKKREEQKGKELTYEEKLKLAEKAFDEYMTSSCGEGEDDDE
jgi:hypothetical protein